MQNKETGTISLCLLGIILPEQVARRAGFSSFAGSRAIYRLVRYGSGSVIFWQIVQFLEQWFTFTFERSLIRARRVASSSLFSFSR